MSDEVGYSIAVEAEPFEGTIDRVDDRLDDILEALLKETEGPAVSGNEHGLALRFSLVYAGLQRIPEVVAAGNDIASRVLANTGLADLVTTSISAETEEHLERDINTPLPELVGLSEIAEILGVSKQRVGQLRERPDFPLPVAALKSGPVWSRPMLSRFIDEWPRRGGRPPAFGPEELEQLRKMGAEDTETLSPRELQVLRRLADGLPAAEIGPELGMSPDAVRSTVRRILTKLDLHSRLASIASLVSHSDEGVKSEPRT